MRRIRDNEAAPATGWDQWLLVKPGEKSPQHLYGESFVKYFAFAKADPAYDIFQSSLVISARFWVRPRRPRLEWK